MIVDQLCISCHRNLKLSPIVTVEMSFGFLPGVVSCKDVSMSANIVHKIRHLFKSEGMREIYDIITFKCSLFQSMKLGLALNKLEYQKRKD